jgi:hypothetical protein
LAFEINKILVKPVVFAVADNGRGILVIQLIVLADFLSQLRDVFLGFGSVHRSFHDTNTRNFGNRGAVRKGRACALPRAPIWAQGPEGKGLPALP